MTSTTLDKQSCFFIVILNMNSSSLFIVYLVVNLLFIIYLLRLLEGVLKPLLTYLLTLVYTSRNPSLR